MLVLTTNSAIRNNNMITPDNFFEIEETPEVPDHSLWVERYRPKTLDVFISNEELKGKAKQWIADKSIPHLLFTGPPGTGKTSLAKLLIKHIPCDHLFINASDENGIDSIRTKVQDFCMTMGTQPIKIMFLDEADRLTPEAQDMMRNLMESFSETTRFILTCNYKERITDAIDSRSQRFEVKPPSKGEVMKKLVDILTAEKIQFDPKDAAFIVSSYFPDMRKIINFAQQSSIGGQLKIAKADSTDRDYKTKLIDLLKLHTKAGIFTEVRQLVADAVFSNYEEVYRYLFDHVNDFAGPKAPEVILILAEAVYQSALVFEREITFVAFMHKILTAWNEK